MLVIILTELVFVKERMLSMDKRKAIIERIELLTDEQFEALIVLWSQQEQEFALSGQVERQTSPQPAL
jgi:hypothetical protein